MSVTSLLVPCPNIQDALDQNFLTCGAASMREPMPFLEFVASEANNFGIKQKVAPGNAKIKTVELTYRQRFLEGEIDENVTNPSCTATTKVGNESTNYTMDSTENVGKSVLFEISDWTDICDSGEAVVAMELQRIIDGVVRKLATKTATQAALLAGGWNSGVDNLTGDILEVATLKSIASGDIAPFAMQDIDMAFMQSGWCAARGIFSGSQLYKYYGQMLAGCCANMGVDLGQIMAQFGYAVAYDKYIATALGGNEFALASQLGSMALLTWTQNSVYDGANLLSRGLNYYPTTIFDPQTGIPMDLNIKNDCGQISVQVVATTKLVALPADMFQASDANSGVNFSAVIEVVNT